MNFQRKVAPASGLTHSPGVGSEAPFSFRAADCHECEGSGLISTEWRDGWTGCETCRDCRGSGETDAACADCNVVTALNDDGLCRRCFDAGELPLAEFQARYLGQGWSRVEL